MCHDYVGLLHAITQHIISWGKKTDSAKAEREYYQKRRKLQSKNFPSNKFHWQELKAHYE